MTHSSIDLGTLQLPASTNSLRSSARFVQDVVTAEFKSVAIPCQHQPAAVYRSEITKICYQHDLYKAEQAEQGRFEVKSRLTHHAALQHSLHVSAWLGKLNWKTQRGLMTAF